MQHHNNEISLSEPNQNLYLYTKYLNQIKQQDPFRYSEELILFFKLSSVLLHFFYSIICILNSPYIQLLNNYTLEYKKDANFAEPKLVRDFTNFRTNFYQLCPENLRYFTVFYDTPKRIKTAGNTGFSAVQHSYEILGYIPICFASFLRRSCNPVFLTFPSALQLRRQSFLLFQQDLHQFQNVQNS